MLALVEAVDLVGDGDAVGSQHGSGPACRWGRAIRTAGILVDRPQCVTAVFVADVSATSVFPVTPIVRDSAGIA